MTYGGSQKTLASNTIQYSYPIDTELNYTIPKVYSSVDGCNITFIPSVSSGSEIVGGSVHVNFIPVESCIKFKPYFAIGSQNTVLNYSVKTNTNSTVLLAFTNGNSGVIGFNLPPNCVKLQGQSYNDVYYCIEKSGNYSINLNTGTTSNELAAAYVFNGTDYSIASAASSSGYGSTGMSAGLSASYPLLFCIAGGNGVSPNTQNGSILSASSSGMWYVVDSSSCSSGKSYSATASISLFSVIQNSSAPNVQRLTTTFSESGLNMSADWSVNLNGGNQTTASNIMRFSTLTDQELNYTIPNVSVTANNCTTTFTPSVKSGSIISGGSVSVNFAYNRVCG